MTALGLSGTLPVELFSSPRLYSLNLAGNALGGPLPALGNGSANGTAPAAAAALRWLDLSGNSLSGDLPADWASLSFTRLSLAWNNLTGARASGRSRGLRMLRLAGVDEETCAFPFSSAAFLL
jgi:hypothetical protein